MRHSSTRTGKTFDPHGRILEIKRYPVLLALLAQSDDRVTDKQPDGARLGRPKNVNHSEPNWKSARPRL